MIGSTDNSLELIQPIIENDNRVIIINQINKGVSEVRNIGVKYAKGDSDDYLDNNCLFDLYYKANKYNLDILYFEEEKFNDKINLTNQKNDNSLKKENYILKIYRGIDLFVKMEKKNLIFLLVYKLLKKNFKKINFNFILGILFEGIIIYLTSILQAEKTCYVNNPFYKF